MGTKKHRMTVGLDSEDLAFLNELGVFNSTGEGIRWCIKFCRLYGIQAISAIRKDDR
jgi:hypothetical protein